MVPDETSGRYHHGDLKNALIEAATTVPVQKSADALSLREVARAGVDELARIKGINHRLAQQIYDAFHGE